MHEIVMQLFRPRVNFGRKQKVDFQNFVPEGHPKTHRQSPMTGNGSPL